MLEIKGKGGLGCHQLYCLGSCQGKAFKVEEGLCYSSQRCPYLFQQTLSLFESLLC